MQEKTGRTYFSAVGVLLLVLSVVAFSDNLFTNVGQPSNGDPKFVVHGLFGLAWYVLLAVQANLVRVRNVKLHASLGVAAFVVALGVAITTVYIFVAIWTGWDRMPAEARANRLLLPGFATCILLAWLHRRRADRHKRLIFVGTFLMLGPVLSRSYDPLIVSWMEPLFPAFTSRFDEAGFQTFFWGAWIGFFLSLAIYDRRTLGHVHAVTAAGAAWLGASWLVSALT